MKKLKRRRGARSVAKKAAAAPAHLVTGLMEADEEDEGSSSNNCTANHSLCTGVLSTEVQNEANSFEQQQPRTVVIERPPVGFFIQGSTISEMNGVYVKQSPPVYEEEEEGVQTLLYYKHVDNQWTLEHLRRSGSGREWTLTDQDGADRFVQYSPRLVPGAGVRWEFVHHTSGPGGVLVRGAKEPAALVGQQVAEVVTDDEDELPWQVIALLDTATLREVLDGNDQHMRRCCAEEVLTGGSDGRGEASDAMGQGDADGDADGGDCDSIANEADHYKVLGVASDANDRQIQHAYRMASLKHHPDRKGGSKQGFQRVQHAYEILADEGRRRTYDLGSKDEAKKEAQYESWRHLFCPFGDPFVKKRKLAAQRSRAEAAEQKREPRPQSQQQPEASSSSSNSSDKASSSSSVKSRRPNKGRGM
jgi:hypothetical protein